MKNPYRTLGVAENASASDIKSAFRAQAKACHPDHNPGDKAKEEQFKELVKAYELLTDEKRRMAFDSEVRIAREAEARRQAAERAQQAQAEQFREAVRKAHEAQARQKAANDQALREAFERLRRGGPTSQKPEGPGMNHPSAAAPQTAPSTSAPSNPIPAQRPSPLGPLLGLAALIGIAVVADAREERRGKWDHRVQRRRGRDGRFRPNQ